MIWQHWSRHFAPRQGPYNVNNISNFKDEDGFKI
jgi:hypothetical protein